jgi:hypothetical protein
MRPRLLFPHACGVCRTTAFLIAALAAAAASARDSDGLWPAGVAAELEALLAPEAVPAPAAAEASGAAAGDDTPASEPGTAASLSADENTPCVLELITQSLSRPSTPVTRAPGVAEPGLAAPADRDESLREIDRVVDLIEANPLLRGTLRHALNDEEADTEGTLPPLGNQDPDLIAPPPGDARLELCPVWGRVRGAMVRLIF